MLRSTIRGREAELAFLLLVVGAGAMGLYIGLTTPASQWEPLGAGAFPTVLGGLTLGLALVKAAGLLAAPADESGKGPGGALWRIAAAFGLIVLYVAALVFQLFHFVVATGFFCFAFFALLALEKRPMRLIGMAVVSVLLAIAVFGIFTRFFFLNL
ncbi:hypothetical protein OCH239_14785 [Roseivivax halodurans JCM 10272]|uniref:DUF1468 domain-containing protein n=1 Tax=Roseivivax halodurans JCM 10272 TaxID=1449350 RepID=X7EAZ8_9RHOB|nr:tripartite tricarboxylate transporter TctB family protein [Roseivivax halodurans]ETX13030.1 hypothetical protein OCH239_14785 [Roseivivax halodurans JCM 10272]